jgi:hypothetical protein
LVEKALNTKIPRNHKEHERRLKLFLFFIFVNPPWRMFALWLGVEYFFAALLRYEIPILFE